MTIPYWSAALAGIIYATGFLIEFTFLQSMGIQDPVEGFKAKYIYIGLLCLQFPTSVCLLVVAYRRIKRQDLEKESGPHFSTVCLISILLLNFYLLTTFSRPGIWHQRWPQITAVFTLVLFALVVRSLEEWANTLKEKWRKRLKMIEGWGARMRWRFVLIACALTIWIFWTTWPLLFNMIVEAGFLYIGLVLTIGVLVARTDSHAAQAKNRGVLGPGLLYALVITATFAYLSTIVFAYRLYPYIPAERGGGDYSTEAPSILTFDARFSDSLPPQIVDSTQTDLQSKPVIILHETETTLFLTVPHSTDPSAPHAPDPNDQEKAIQAELESWRKIGPENKPTPVFAISRTCVVGITLQRKSPSY
jgi:hypothetical protein